VGHKWGICATLHVGRLTTWTTKDLTDMHTQTHKHTDVHTQMFTHMHTCTRTRRHSHTHKHTQARTNKSTHKHKHTYTYTCSTRLGAFGKLLLGYHTGSIVALLAVWSPACMNSLATSASTERRRKCDDEQIQKVPHQSDDVRICVTDHQPQKASKRQGTTTTTTFSE